MGRRLAKTRSVPRHRGSRGLGLIGVFCCLLQLSGVRENSCAGLQPVSARIGPMRLTMTLPALRLRPDHGQRFIELLIFEPHQDEWPGTRRAGSINAGFSRGSDSPRPHISS